MDKNDNEPQFDRADYVFDYVPLLSSNTFQSNRLLGTVRATDRDAGANGEVTYSLLPAAGEQLSDPPTRFLQVDSLGSIHQKFAFDRETHRYRFLVLATDRGAPSRSASVLVQLVEQPPREPPRVEFHFAEPFRTSDAGVKEKHVTVPAGALQHHLVVRLNATCTSRQQLRYSIRGDADQALSTLLRLTPHRGELLLQRSADAIRRDGHRTLLVPVIASDMNNPKICTATAVLFVELAPAAGELLHGDDALLDDPHARATTAREPQGLVGWLARHSSAIVLACFLVILVCLVAFVLILLLFYVRSKSSARDAHRRRGGLAARLADCLWAPGGGERRETKTAARGATAVASTRLAFVSGEKHCARRTFSNNENENDEEDADERDLNGKLYHQHSPDSRLDDEAPDEEADAEADAEASTPNALEHMFAAPAGVFLFVCVCTVVLVHTSVDLRFASVECARRRREHMPRV